MHSVYIHIPFCSNICSYCRFSKFLYRESSVLKYLKALEKEIKTNYKKELIKTIYIGGGTPSSLNIDELEKLFQIIKIFKFDTNLEFTVEVNPENITLEKLQLFKKNKVNRISIGIESTNKKYLKYLNRLYDFNLVKEKIKLIKMVGIDNINVDLMYAIKNQTLKELSIDLDNIISLDIKHISTYSLMIEPNTILGIKKEKPIDDELDYKMYNLIIKKLKEHNFIHYEVSNFSKVGYESKHNLVYWSNLNYYGFGLGASGFINNIRYTNTTSLQKYNQLVFISEYEVLTKKDMITYELILGFRKIEGINKQEFFNKYKLDIHEVFNIKDLLDKKYLEENSSNIYIKYDKIYVENSILINFVGE